MKIAAHITLVLAVVLLFSFQANAESISAKLTAEELEQVKSGKILLKNDIDEKTQKGSGVAFGIYHCSLDDFWNTIYDYPNYADIFPRIIYAKIIKKEEKQFLTEFKLDASLTKLEYVSYNRPSDDKLRLDFGLDPNYPHKYQKSMTGYWQLEKLGENLYLAEYKVQSEIDAGAFTKLIAPIVNAMAGKDLPKVMRAVRMRVESGGTWKLSDGFKKK